MQPAVGVHTSYQILPEKMQANLEHASAYGFFADENSSAIAVSEQDVQDVAEASAIGEQQSMHYRLRKRRAIMRNPDSHAAQLLCSGGMLPEPVLDGSDNSVVTLRIRWLNNRKLQERGMLPVFAEGDTIVGVTEASRGKEGEMSSSDDDDGDSGGGGNNDNDTDGRSSSSSSSEDVDAEEADEEGGLLAGGVRRERRIMMRKTRTHTHVFRVCAVYWGVKAYVNMMIGGGGSALLSASSSSSMESGRASATQNCFVVCRLITAG